MTSATDKTNKSINNTIVCEPTLDSNLTIRPEQSNDLAAVRRVHLAAFPQAAEANLVDALRTGGFDRLSLVAEHTNQTASEIVGHVLFSALTITSESESHHALALAPVAVANAWQNQGIGSSLIRAGLAQAKEAGHRIVIVLGEPAYYRRFGFSASLALPLQSAYACEAFMALELMPGALQGVQGEVCYAPPFAALE